MSKFLRQKQSLPFVFRFVGSRLSSFYMFPINPQHFSLTLPTRGSVIQTMTSNFENFFGAGVPKGQLRGTFGLRARPQWGLAGLPLPGQLQSRFLELLIGTFYNEAQETIRKENASVQFLDLSDSHYLRVRFLDFQYERSTNHQFLHHFNINFVVLEDFLNPIEGLPEGTILSKLSSPIELLADLKALAGDLLSIQTGDAVGKSILEATKPIKEAIVGAQSHGLT